MKAEEEQDLHKIINDLIDARIEAIRGKQESASGTNAEVGTSANVATATAGTTTALPTHALSSTTSLSALYELEPGSASVWERYKSVRSSVKDVYVGDRGNFPSTENCGFSKEDKALLSLVRDTHKLCKVLLQLSIAGAEAFPQAEPIFEDIATVAIAGMRNQLHTRDNLWMKRHCPTEVQHAFNAFEGSTLTGENRQRFFDAVALAGLRKTAQPAPRNNGHWRNRRGEAGQSGRHYPSNKPNQPASRNPGQGAGPSASRN